MKMRNKWVYALLALLLGSVACFQSGGFVPAPPPVDAKNVVNINQLKVGDNAQLMSIASPLIDVNYRENGSCPGKTATEIVELADGTKATMLSTCWGSWDNGDLVLVNYYDPDGELLSGMIDARFEELSLFQLFTGNIDYTLDRSSVILLYERDVEATNGLRLTKVQYSEKWGPAKKELAFGGYAVWTRNFDKLLPARFSTYGFWEKNNDPAGLVRELLQSAMTSAQSNNVVPSFKAVDEDSGREVLGRQTGLRLYKDGTAYGSVVFDYANTWGRQPNTNLIGDGSLSRITWNLGFTSYHLVILSPKASPVGSSLYVFTTDAATADKLATQANSDNAQKLYDPLRNGEYPGVFLVAYAIGDIGKIPGTGEDAGPIGDEGGVQWRTLGEPSYEDIVLASNLLATLGPAQYMTGFYYAYKAGSGSGMSYYLAALRLMYAPKETVFSVFNQDVGVLDRVLVPDLDMLPPAK